MYRVSQPVNSKAQELLTVDDILATMLRTFAVLLVRSCVAAVDYHPIVLLGVKVAVAQLIRKHFRFMSRTALRLHTTRRIIALVIRVW